VSGNLEFLAGAEITAHTCFALYDLETTAVKFAKAIEKSAGNVIRFPKKLAKQAYIDIA